MPAHRPARLLQVGVYMITGVFRPSGATCSDRSLASSMPVGFPTLPTPRHTLYGRTVCAPTMPSSWIDEVMGLHQ
jgi:hypothetical protein